MINIFSIFLLNKFCFGNNTSDLALNYTYRNMSELLEAFGEPIVDSADLIELPNTNQTIYEHIINNRPKQLIVEKSSLSDGPFYNLIVNICNTILYKFKTHKIPKYIKVLGESVKRLGHEYLKILVRHVSRKLKNLSQCSGLYIKRKVRYFLKNVQKEQPRRIEFFKSMNTLFSNIYWDSKMDEYIWLLQDFGKGQRRSIDQETRRLCSVMFDKLYKQRRKMRDAILDKLMMAYREYLIDSVSVRFEIEDV